MKKMLPLILFTLAFVNRMFSQLPVSPTLATANVPEASQYGVLYQLDIGTSGTYNSLNSIGYAIDNSALALNYSRVAYFLQLDNKWVWVSMNDFSTTNAQLGIPYFNSGVVWQQTVSAMNVYGSANSGVTTTVNATGNIEMWSNCYGTGNGLANIGGNSSTYDFNDTYTNFDCYGSFQVHNFGAQQSIFAFNAFATNSNYDLGIGNNTVVVNGNPDWTYMANASTYTTKKLWILINNVYITTQPSVASATACIGGTATPISITAGVNSGTINSYEWYSNTLNSNTGGTLVATNTTSATINTFTPSTTNAGTLYYYCVVNGTNGSFFKSEVSGARVTANPIVTISGAATICVGNNISLVASAAGAAGTYTWSTGANTTSINVNPTSATVYSVAFTNAGGCIGTNSVTINTTALPVLSISGPTAICAGQTASLSGSGATTYTWSTNSNATSINVSPTSNMTYTLRGTSSGCTDSTTAVLNVNALPVITVNSGSICAGQSFNIIPGGAATYTVQGGTTNVNPNSNATYTVVGTSAAGCISSSFATSSVTVNANPTITVNSGSICAGQSFNILPSGASTYTLQGGNATVSPAANTSYTVMGTNLAGCVSQNFATSNVTVNTNPVITVNNGAICAGQSFTLNPNGASTYTVQGGSLVVSPTANASYTILGTSAEGCVSPAFATSNVTVNPNPVITVNNGTICAGQSFNILPGGASTYTIQGGTATVSPLTNATYTVRGTSAAGCISAATATSSITVNVNPTITVNSGSICAGQSFTLLPSGASTYTVQGGTTTVSPTANASYTVTGTNLAGCVSQNFATSSVTVNTLPTLAISGTTTLCAGSSVSLIANGATTYTWSTAANTATINVSPATNTTYSLTGTSLAGCTGNTATLAVTVNTLPVIALSGTNALCAGSSATLSAAGANTYTWSTGSNATSITESPALTSTYTVIGRSAAGCAGNTASLVLTVNPNPTLNITGASGICTGQNASLTANGAATYSWSTGSTSSSIVTSPASNTTYTVTGTSPFGCTTTTTQSVTVQASLSISVAGPTAVCNGQNANLTGLGGVTYTWNTGATTATIAPTITTTTTFSVLGASGTCSNTAIFTVAVNANPTLAVTGNTAICNGNTTTLTASGATNYSWTSGSNTAAAVLSPTTSTTYSVSGSFTTGCADTRTIAVTVYSLPVIAITGSNVICTGDTTVLNVSGAATYTWNTAANTTSISVNPTTTVTYTAAGTSTDGCISFAVSTVTVNALPIMTLTGNSAICAGASQTLSIAGANTYTWNTSVNGNTVVLTPTITSGVLNFSVTGTSTAGCNSFLTDSLVVNAIPSLTIAGGSYVCNGNTLTLNASGAATYSWNTGATTNSLAVTPSVNTSYSVVGTSTAGCSGMAVNDVTVVALPSVLIAGDSVICFGDSLTLVASGANTYSWSTGSTSSLVVVKPLANTSYSLVGEIGAGCSDTTQTSITVNSLPSLSLTVASNTICLGEQTIISIDGASTYTWNTASNSNSISVSPTLTTMYSVAGTGSNTCVSRDSLSLVVSECLSITKQNIAALTRVYPNPTAGVFVIETPAANAEIRIVNVFGQTILNTTTTGKTMVDLAAYSKGIYFVYILQDNNIVYKNAVIKD